jgi:hypothetical protein
MQRLLLKGGEVQMTLIRSLMLLLVGSLCVGCATTSPSAAYSAPNAAASAKARAHSHSHAVPHAHQDSQGILFEGSF